MRRLVIARTIGFAAVVLLLLCLLEIFNFKWPSEQVSDKYVYDLFARAFYIVLISFGAMIGALVGFRLFPTGAWLSFLRLMMLGAFFTVLNHVTVPKVAEFMEVQGVLIYCVVLALIVVQTVGRALATRDLKPSS